MSTKYKFLDPEGIYFDSFATVDWEMFLIEQKSRKK